MSKKTALALPSTLVGLRWAFLLTFWLISDNNNHRPFSLALPRRRVTIDVQAFSMPSALLSSITVRRRRSFQWEGRSSPHQTHSFSHTSFQVYYCCHSTLWSKSDGDEVEENGDSDDSNEDRSSADDDDDNAWRDELQRRAEQVRVEETRQALESARLQRMLQSKPRKLPYRQAREWVQCNWAIDTEEEWIDMVANGNLRTPYIPKQPQQYYTNTGEWKGWDHFLHGFFEERDLGLDPVTGVLD